jgi:hypothetical protein
MVQYSGQAGGAGPRGKEKAAIFLFCLPNFNRCVMTVSD